MEIDMTHEPDQKLSTIGDALIAAKTETPSTVEGLRWGETKKAPSHF
jgi:hypothetical protein